MTFHSPSSVPSSMSFALLAALATVSLSPSSFAQELVPGKPAPALAVAKWVKGAPVAELKKEPLLSLPACGSAAVLLLCVMVGEYVEPQRLLWNILAALILGPAAYAWRKAGERRARFCELDDSFQRHFQPTAAGAQRSHLEALIAAIEGARGAERQVARVAAKRWLEAHAHDLTAEERALVEEHLAYLWPPRTAD